MNDLEVRTAAPADRLPVYRMLELYQHDLSDVWDQDLDVHGEYGYALDDYWTRPKHEAFVLRVAGHYAGFALVDGKVRLPDGDWWLAQFFVLKKYRRRGVGQAAAQQVFDTVRGRWQVGQMPGNHTAQAFWRRTIAAYTGGAFTEHDLDDERWHGRLHCFDNTPTSP